MRSSSAALPLVFDPHPPPHAAGLFRGAVAVEYKGGEADEDTQL
jgi:hypothetical protein